MWLSSTLVSVPPQMNAKRMLQIRVKSGVNCRTLFFESFTAIGGGGASSRAGPLHFGYGRRGHPLERVPGSYMAPTRRVKLIAYANIYSSGHFRR